MKKLTTMTDFVLEQNYNDSNEHLMNYKNIYNYANFLKQPLELWMFVPCDENRNVLEEPVYKEYSNCDELDEYDNKCVIYQQVKERCLFDGLFLCDDGFIRAEDSYILFSVKSMVKETIEDMIYYDVNLTQTAIKQIGL